MSTDSMSSPAPFSFTAGQFTRGALVALLVAVPLVSIACFPYVAVIMLVLPFGFGLLLMFALPAALVGRLMRRVRNPWLHVLAWFAFGVLVAATAFLPLGFLSAAPPPLIFIASGLATVLGWRHAAVSAGALRPWRPGRSRAAVTPASGPVAQGVSPATTPPPRSTVWNASGRPFAFRVLTVFSGTAVGLSVFALFALLRRLIPVRPLAGIYASFDLFFALPHILITMVLAWCLTAVMQYVARRWVQWLVWTSFAVGATLAATLIIPPANTGWSPTDDLPVGVLVITGSVSVLAGWAFAFRSVLFQRYAQEPPPSAIPATPTLSA